MSPLSRTSGETTPLQSDSSEISGAGETRISVSKTLVGLGPISGEKPNPKKSGEILNGDGLNSLDEDIRVYKTALGDIAYAATDKGIGYSKHNEDRVGVETDKNFFIVADGVGGHEKGEIAAEIVVEAFLNNPEDSHAAAKMASEMMIVSGIKTGCACYAAAQIVKINGRKYLDVSQAGDVKALVIRKEKLVFESKDQNIIQDFLDDKLITEDEALYHPNRNFITNSIGPTRYNPEIYDAIPVKQGDIVIIMTDGISNNLTPREIIKLISGARSKHIIPILSNVTDGRMTFMENIINETNLMGGRGHLRMYSDGFLSEPKPDNRAVVVVEIK